MSALVDPVWRAARMALLEKERQLTHLRDEIAAERRALPRVPVTKPYRFEGPGGALMLSDLFGAKSQLALYHFMLGPDWEEPCKSCSFWAEQFDAIRVHLQRRDVELAAASRAPIAKIMELKERFAWRFPWYSTLGDDFNFDFGVSFDAEKNGPGAYNFGLMQTRATEMPGISAFIKDDSGHVLHTYSAYGRGLDALNGVYQFLDLAPLGRNETGLAWPMAWVRHKNRYDEEDAHLT